MKSAETAQQFRDYVLRTYKAQPGIQEKEAWVLFNAIQDAFNDSNAHRQIAAVPIELVSNLAACSWVALMYDKDQKIRWKESDHDYVLTRLWRGFFKYVLLSVRRKQHQFSDECCYVGCLEIPRWLTDVAADPTLHPDLK